jgi:WD40 repeat protein
VRLSDAETYSESLIIDSYSEVYGLKFSPNGKMLAAAAADDHYLRIWNISAGRQVGIWRGHDGQIVDIAWKPDNTAILTASSDRTARIWPVSDAELPDVIESGDHSVVLRGHLHRVGTASWSPDGKLLARKIHQG